MYLKLRELTYEQKVEVLAIMDYKELKPKPTPETVDQILRKMMNHMKRSNTMWQGFIRKIPGRYDEFFEDRDKHLFQWLIVRKVERKILWVAQQIGADSEPTDKMTLYHAFNDRYSGMYRKTFLANVCNLMKHGFFAPISKGESRNLNNSFIMTSTALRYVKYHMDEILNVPWSRKVNTELDHLLFYQRNPHRLEEKYGRKFGKKELDRIKFLQSELDAGREIK